MQILTNSIIFICFVVLQIYKNIYCALVTDADSGPAEWKKICIKLFIYRIIFFLPAIVTSNLMITDRLEGVWERSAVAGVKAKEMLYVHIVLQTAVILLQVC